MSYGRNYDKAFEEGYPGNKNNSLRYEGCSMVPRYEKDRDRDSASYGFGIRSPVQGYPERCLSPPYFNGNVHNGRSRHDSLPIRTLSEPMISDNSFEFRNENKRKRHESSKGYFLENADQGFEPSSPKRFMRSSRSSKDKRDWHSTSFDNCRPLTPQLSMYYDSISDDEDLRPPPARSITSNFCSDQENDLAADLVDYIITRGNMVKISSMESSTFPFKRKIESQTAEGTILAFLNKFGHVFNITESPDDTNSEIDYFVSCTLNLEICEDYASSPLMCYENCKQLHLCKSFVINSCHKRECIFSHELDDHHNKPIVTGAFAHKVHSEDIMGYLLKIQTPRTCTYYNAAGCNRNNACPFLHVCKHFVVGDCKFGQQCKRSHNLFDRQPFDILGKYELNNLLLTDQKCLLQRIASEEHGKSKFEWELKYRDDGFCPEITPEDKMRLERKFQQYLEAKISVITILGQSTTVDFSKMEGKSSDNEIFDLDRFFHK